MHKRDWQHWFGLRCLLLCCPGSVITSKRGSTWWQCRDCGAQSKPE